jgi:glycosyltransferase involved in cell wall biosynthesis
VLNLTPFVLTPFNKGIFSRPEVALRQWFTFNGMPKKIRDLGMHKPDLVIQDKAGLYFMRNFFRAKAWIYRATDDYSKMPRSPGLEAIKKLEEHICRSVDHVVVTSRPLQRLFYDRYRVDALVIRNGVDVPHFSEEFHPPDEYSNIEKPIILYVGSMDQRFDHELLVETARKSPDWQFILIGPGGSKIVPKNLSNITALGPRDYAEVPAYMQHADVGILPLKKIEANHARSPMKIYEYGLCGLPVVSTPLRELIYRNEKFVTFAKNAPQFHDKIRYCLEHRQNMEEDARLSSSKHSWNSIAYQILELAFVSSHEVL